MKHLRAFNETSYYDTRDMDEILSIARDEDFVIDAYNFTDYINIRILNVNDHERFKECMIDITTRLYYKYGAMEYKIKNKFYFVDRIHTLVSLNTIEKTFEELLDVLEEITFEDAKNGDPRPGIIDYANSMIFYINKENI